MANPSWTFSKFRSSKEASFLRFFTKSYFFDKQTRHFTNPPPAFWIELCSNFPLAKASDSPIKIKHPFGLLKFSNSPAMQQKTNALLKNETEWNSRFKRKSPIYFENPSNLAWFFVAQGKFKHGFMLLSCHCILASLTWSIMNYSSPLESIFCQNLS